MPPQPMMPMMPMACILSIRRSTSNALRHSRPFSQHATQALRVTTLGRSVSRSLGDPGGTTEDAELSLWKMGKTWDFTSKDGECIMNMVDFANKLFVWRLNHETRRNIYVYINIYIYSFKKTLMSEFDSLNFLVICGRFTLLTIAFYGNAPQLKCSVVPKEWMLHAEKCHLI